MYQCKKVLSLKHSVRATLSHASRTAKITVFDLVTCKTRDASLQDKLLCRTCVVYCYFY